MPQLIAGNWKMNLLTRDARSLLQALRDDAASLACDLLVCPPFTQLSAAAALLEGSPIRWGGQDCHAQPGGAHTGDISAAMLTDLGCTAVILGHSERRQNHHETDSLVRAKAAAAARAGLTAIVCVGESDAQRDAGHAYDVVGGQIAASLPDDFAGVIAYEPIWAIGTGHTPTLAEVAAMHRHIREALLGRLGGAGASLRILYGGSVKADNAATFLAVPDVGGALVGGASLNAPDFLAIARASRA